MLISGSLRLASFQMHDGGSGSGWWVVMMLAMTVLWVAIAAAVIAYVRRDAGEGARETDEPLAIAQRRLARGEISAEEYERLRDVLGRNPADSG